MYRPIIDQDKCELCEECIDICPTDVFGKFEGLVVVADPQDCIGCESCIGVCVPEAIAVEEI
jgi:NAD-dependent dihydropyrimidine dehydrogenase PreA subunit